MPRLRGVLRKIADGAGRFEQQRVHLRRRLRGARLHIAAYAGYGTATAVWMRGRVLADPRLRPARDDDSAWQNFVNMYRRFQSDEVPGARVRAEIAGVAQEVVADDEGYFDLELALGTPLPAHRIWHTVQLTLLEPRNGGQPLPQAQGQVLVPPPNARFGVVSDLDDTVIKTNVTNMVRMARTVLLSNARTRLAFPGVAALYQALQQGVGEQPSNPIFYVSTSPWNIYDLLVDFLAIQQIPHGPLLLRDWGISRRNQPVGGHGRHKLAAIRRILDRFPHLPFLLIGDSGQQDPEVYSEIVRHYPRRILAIYIRSVRDDPQRLRALDQLAEAVAAGGSTLLVADDTLAMARHAVHLGFIDPAALELVSADKHTGTPLPESFD